MQWERWQILALLKKAETENPDKLKLYVSLFGFLLLSIFYLTVFLALATIKFIIYALVRVKQMDCTAIIMTVGIIFTDRKSVV